MLVDYKEVNIYQDNNLVLENVDFHADKGELIYLIGKVGAGKSSFLKTTYCELDLVKDEAEKVEVLGRDLKLLKRKDVPDLRREMGIIFQDFQLLHDRTVFNNLLFVLKSTGWKDKREIRTRIDKVLVDVNMIDKKDKMPYELSGGEQQRVAIARAILNEPKIIVADEPTGNLDEETASNIVSLLKSITKTGTAVVMSTHNLMLINKFPGIVYRCSDGKMHDVTKEYSNTNSPESKA